MCRVCTPTSAHRSSDTCRVTVDARPLASLLFTVACRPAATAFPGWRRVTGKAPSQLAVYDPFYCQGGIRRHYEQLGFTNFIHR